MLTGGSAVGGRTQRGGRAVGCHSGSGVGGWMHFFLCDMLWVGLVYYTCYMDYDMGINQSNLINISTQPPHKHKQINKQQQRSPGGGEGSSRGRLASSASPPSRVAGGWVGVLYIIFAFINIRKKTREHTHNTLSYSLSHTHMHIHPFYHHH